MAKYKLSDSVSILKGVGDKNFKILNSCGITKIEDLILYFPRDYDFLNVNSNKGIFEGKVVAVLKDVFIRKNLVLTTIKMCGENNVLFKVIYFNKPYMKQCFIVGSCYKVYGSFKNKASFIEILNGEIIKDLNQDIVPKYNLVKGLSNNFFRNIIKQVLENIDICENILDILIDKNQLLSLKEAVCNIHLPESKYKLECAIKRFKYQEFIYFFLKIKILKSKLNKKTLGIKFKIFTQELILLKESLGFVLTNDQNKVIKEILLAQKGEFSINRLLQGDVGSGKTVVALITAFNVLLNGYKVCFMVPTEILAYQHYNEAVKLFEKFNIKIRILTGSVKVKEKNIIKEELKSDEPILLIGTHAVLEDDVCIHNLGYVIFDEQQRFGVSQRSKLISKSNVCDVLVMTATPIPRTLFLYIYNDMDISTIRELPSHRKKIITRHLKQEDRKNVHLAIKSEVDKGGQCYVVCPLVDESDKLDILSVKQVYDEFNSSELSCYKVGMLHGKMKSSEKNEIMDMFKNGELDILISTTVIEVGVSVSNATLIVVENAERFGLAQLHQLRGRVGRGYKEGTCILVTKTMNTITKKRIATLLESNDGFYLADQDLKIRGSGDIFGYKQHGDSGFVFANVIDDIDILRKVKEDIDELETIYENDKVIEFYNNVKKNLDNLDKGICFN